jgi:ribosomal protein L37AE/L43A
VIYPFIAAIKRAVVDLRAERRRVRPPMTEAELAKSDERFAELIDRYESLQQSAPTTTISFWEEIKALPSAVRMRWTARRKRRICPRCGKRGVREIIYGLVLPGTRSDADVIRGGCVQFEGSPRWSCKKCHAKLQDADVGYVRPLDTPLTDEDLLRNFPRS